MSNKFVEPPLKISQNSTYTWTLYYSEISKLSKEDYSFRQTFPDTEKKWKGMLHIYYTGCCEVELLFSADETFRAKYSLFLLDRKNKILKDGHGEITTSKYLTPEGFKYHKTLQIDNDMFEDDSDFIQVRVIIQENASKVPKALRGTNTSPEISEQNYETKTLQEINTNKILKNDLKMMFENKEFSDFVIKLNDCREIPVHRNILAARSPVFSAMLKSDSSEKNEGYVKITDINKNTMMLLLNYIYTGNITSDLSVDGAKNLLSAADKYGILDLKLICGKYLKSCLEISNAIDILMLSELYNVPELKNCAFKFIIDNKESYLDPVKFEKVGKRFPNLMIELVTESFKNKT